MDLTDFFRYFYTCKLFYALGLFNIKYYLPSVIVVFVAFKTLGQTVSSSNATLTIIGDPLPDKPDNNAPAPANPYINTTQPPDKTQQLATPQNIEPTFDNGFHIRYEINTPQKTEERPAAVSTENNGYAYASISGGGGVSTGEKNKRKHVVTIAERSFNFKKRVKSWAPKRKKKYRPHICGRF